MMEVAELEVDEDVVEDVNALLVTVAVVDEDAVLCED